MNTPDSDRRVCEQCGAPMGRHMQDGLCSRCIAQFSLLEPEDGEERPEVREQTSDSGGPLPVRPVQAPPSNAPNTHSKTRFGDYELLEEIAHGGMGVVYRAQQISLNRIVAVKMLLFGQFAGKTAFDRFRAEAQTAAHLQHPNIVAIHEIGETDGQPYFSMDYVAGRNLAELVRDRPLPALQAAGYVRKIALAVQYAHTRGVLHRDLKPANVLIDEADEPRITDFGLARRLVGDSELTLTGQVVGSPNFMPPEQGGGKKARVGPAGDVYGLGAVLYYLLTARPPFMAETFEATLAQVLNTEPVAPRQLNPGLPLDLETICLKCLEKDPARRYVAASEVADELDRFLKGEPIHARAIGVVGKGWRWCRRKPVLAAMTGAVVVLLLSITLVSLMAAGRIARHARELRLNLYVADMNVAYQAVLDNNHGLARERVRYYLPQDREAMDGAARFTSGSEKEDLRGWEWRYLWKLSRGDAIATLHGHTNIVTCALFSPDGRTVVTAGFDQTVCIWDVTTRQSKRRLTGFADPLQRNSVAFSPDGKLLAVADGADIKVFETTNWSKVCTLPNQAFPGRVTSLPIVFSPNGKTLWCNANGELRQWDTDSWECFKKSLNSRLVDYGSLLAFSPDGQQFAVATDEAVVVYETSIQDSGRELFRIPVYHPMSVVFSLDSKLVVVAGSTSMVMVWDAKAGKEIAQLDAGLPVAFSSDSKRLATAGGIIRLWDIEQRASIASLKGENVVALAFAPDGQTLVSGNNDGTISLWAARAQAVASGLSLQGWRLGFSAGGRMLAVLGTNSAVEYWDFRSRTLVSRFRFPSDIGARSRIVASPDGRLLAVVATNGIARVWDSGSQQAIAEVDLKHTLRWPWAVFSTDGHLLAVSCESLYDGGEGWAAVWDLHQGQVLDLPRGNYYRPSFSADGRVLATGSGSQVQLLSVPDLSPMSTLRAHQWTIKTMAFSSDGTVVASTGRDRDIHLWDVATGKPKALLSANSPNTLSLASAFSLDGRTLVSCEGRDVRLWNVAAGKPLFKLTGLGVPKYPPMFSPDGNTLVAGGSPAPIELIEAPSMAEIEAAEKAERQSP